MIRGLKRRLGRWLMARRVARYGNNHSAAINRHYLAYHRAAKAVWRPAHPGEAAAPEIAAAARRLGEDGFPVRFQPAARPALLLRFGCFLQIHICSRFSVAIILSEIRAKFARSSREFA